MQIRERSIFSVAGRKHKGLSSLIISDDKLLMLEVSGFSIWMI